jgi:phosphoribosylformylglycinamidine synthase
MESDLQLKQVSDLRNLALNDNDIPVIRAYFQNSKTMKSRQQVGLDAPTDVELEYISQARSDHCNHNTFRGLFRYKDAATGKTEIINNLLRLILKTGMRTQSKKTGDFRSGTMRALDGLMKIIMSSP